MFLVLDCLPKFDRFLRTENLGLRSSKAFDNTRKVFVYPSSMSFIKVLQHTGNVTAITTQKLTRIRLLHRLDFPGTQVINFHAGQSVVSGSKLGKP